MGVGTFFQKREGLTKLVGVGCDRGAEMAGDDLLEIPACDPICPIEGFFRGAVEDEGLENGGHEQSTLTAQDLERLLPVGLPLEGK